VDEMQNDAKLGLLAGVVGVIIAATISSKTPTALGTASAPPGGTSPQSSPTANSQAKTRDATAPVIMPGDLGSTPVVQAKKNVDGTTASRSTSDEE
jgi:hypothetical protein